jgi:DNA (cytosine-5)-methyltransferase 1
MDAKYYGVPQSRQRIMFLGVREDLNTEPSYPTPRTRPMTVRAALVGADVSYLPCPLVSAKSMDLVRVVPPYQRGQDVTGKGFWDLKRLAWDKPARTMLKIGYIMGTPVMLHPSENRGFSIGEAKRLSSFPDDFKFAGTWADAWARIGDAVPPLFMRAIAEHIDTKILRMTQDRAGP